MERFLFKVLLAIIGFQETIDKNGTIFNEGHNGIVGSVIWRTLTERGYIILVEASSKEVDLRKQAAVRDYFRKIKPDIIIDAAARVGGIMANDPFAINF